MLREAADLNQQINDFGGTPASIATSKAIFLLSCGKVYAVFGDKAQALASSSEAESLWKKVVGINPQQQVDAEGQIAELCLVRGDLYASSPASRAEARNQYQRAIETLTKLKANNQIVLEGLKQLHEVQQKLQALSG